MTADHSREWRESLGAYALGHLSDDERAGLEAHLEDAPTAGRSSSRSARSRWAPPLADPEQLDTPPSLPRGLGGRVMASIAGEHRRSKRRRFRLGFGLSGATAAVAAAAILAIFVLPGRRGGPLPARLLRLAAGEDEDRRLARTAAVRDRGSRLRQRGPLRRTLQRLPRVQERHRILGRLVPLPLGRRVSGHPQLRPRPGANQGDRDQSRGPDLLSNRSTAGSSRARAQAGFVAIAQIATP